LEKTLEKFMHAKVNPQAPAKVADAVAKTLRKYGARFAFGIHGNDVLETVRACEEQGIEFVLGKSEPSCAFMVDAVYQLTGAPAVLIPALGPGISNAMSGIAGAKPLCKSLGHWPFFELVLSSALRRVFASFIASSFAQKCM
jgi:hypothetical protein